MRVRFAWPAHRFLLLRPSARDATMLLPMSATKARPGRWPIVGWLCAIGGVVALFAALGAYRTVDDPDLYWHLKLGESILEQRAVPAVDELSFTFGGRPFSTDWASEAIMAALHARFGEGGLFGLAAMLAAATMLLTALRMRTPGTPLLAAPATACLLLVYDVASFRFSPRPQTFLFVCLGMLLWLFERAETRRDLRPLWGVPLLVLLWTNLHMSSFVAVVFAGALAMGYLISLHGRWRAALAPHGRQLTCLAVATLVACFAGPRPLGRLQTAVGALFVHGYTTSVLSEWHAPELAYWLGPAGLLLAVLALAFALDWRRAKPHELAVLAVALWLGFRHVRFLPILALVVGPMAYRHLAAALWLRLAGIQGWKRFVPALDGCLAVTMLAGFALGSLGFDSHSTWLGGTGRPHAQLAGRAYPVGATRFLARERLTGNMYNTFHFGGYLMHQLGPAVKVFIDGRTANLYDDAHMRDVMEIRSSWPRVFARWNIQYAITQHGEVETGLVADPHWSLVFFDDAALVFVRKDGPNAEVARRLAYRELLPPFAVAPENDPVRMAGLVSEAQRAVDASPTSALAHILRGRVRALQRDLPGFENDMRTAISLDPSRTEPWQRLGLLALGRHQVAEAVRDLGRALELNPGAADIRYALAAAHWAAGNQVAMLNTLRPIAVGGRTLEELVAMVTRGPAGQALPP